WVGGTNDRAMPVSNPATGEVLAHVPDASREDVWRAIDQAAAAFPKWAHAPAIERGRILRRIYDLMTERREILARLVTQANGKPIEAAKREVACATGYFSWFAEEARRVHGEIVSPPVAEKRLWVMKQPMGVVGAITPWNFPATMVTRKIAPALAAGCTVVLKPASATPLSALALARIADGCRAPARHLQRGHRQPGPDAPGRAAQSPAHPADRLHRLHGDRPRDHGRRRLSDSSGSVSS